MNIQWALPLLFVLSGCNGWVSPETDAGLNDRYFTVFSGPPLPGMIVASAVQWNADYAVTAAHTPFLLNQAYRCSTGCDLLFIAHKATGALPQWRHFRSGEAVTALGSSTLLIPMSATGRVWPVLAPWHLVRTRKWRALITIAIFLALFALAFWLPTVVFGRVKWPRAV